MLHCQEALVATKTEAQRGANLRHCLRTELCDAPSQAVLADGDNVMQIDDAMRFHSIVLGKKNFGRHTSNCGRDRRYGYGR